MDCQRKCGSGSRPSRLHVQIEVLAILKSCLLEPAWYKTTVILSGFLKITRPTGGVSSAAPTDFGGYEVIRRNQGGAALEGSSIRFFGLRVALRAGLGGVFLHS